MNIEMYMKINKCTHTHIHTEIYRNTETCCLSVSLSLSFSHTPACLQFCNQAYSACKQGVAMILDGTISILFRSILPMTSDNVLRTLLRRQDVKLSWTTCCVRGMVLACSNSHVTGLNSNWREAQCLF